MKRASVKEIEVENILASITTDQNAIDQVMNLMKDQQDKSNNQPVFHQKINNDDDIRREIQNESDWRKKASLAALLISRSLE